MRLAVCGYRSTGQF